MARSKIFWLALAAAITLGIGIPSYLYQHKHSLPKKLPDTSFMHQVQTAECLEIVPGGTGTIQDWLVIGKDGAGIQHNDIMMPVFRQSTHFHKQPPKTPCEFEISIAVFDGHPGTFSDSYEYSASTGELGMANEWCIVPDQFKAWMLTLKSKLRKPIHAMLIMPDGNYKMITEADDKTGHGRPAKPKANKLPKD